MGKSVRRKQAEAEIRHQEWIEKREALYRAAQARSTPPAEPLIHRLEDFKQFFIRDPDDFVLKTKSSDRLKQTQELVRFLLHKYPAPAFMSYIWDSPSPQVHHGAYNYHQINQPRRQFRRNFEHELWYVCLSTGGSLYKEYFHEFFTKKETHIFTNCKHDLSIEEALVYSVAKADGAEDGMALRVARSKLNSKKLTDFWKHTIRFFGHVKAITINEINDLVDYINYKHTEHNSTFQIVGVGHTVESLTKKMMSWHYDLRRLKAIGNSQWPGLSVPDHEFRVKAEKDLFTVWKFYQIKTAKELQEEGNSQHHCVFSYRDRCINGSVSIWSLRQVKDEYDSSVTKRKVTIEITRSGEIIQARGYANRKMTGQEHEYVATWAKQEGFYLRSYL